MSWSIPIQISRLVDDLNNKTGFSALQVQNNSTFLSNLNVAGTLTATTSVSVVSLSTNVSQLNVSGNTKLNGATTAISSLNVSGDTILNDLYLPKISGQSILYTDNNGKVQGSNSIPGLTSLSTLLVNPGGATMNSTMNVSGVATFESNLLVKNPMTASSSLTVSGSQTNTSTMNISGATTIESNLLVKQPMTTLSTMNISGYTIFEDSNLIKGSATIGTNLTVNGNATMMSKLNVNNDLHAFNNFDVRKDMTALSNLNVSGSTILNNGTTMNSRLNVSGTTILQHDLFVNQEITANTNLTVRGAQTNISTLNVSGSSVFESNLLVKQPITASSSLTISGNQTNMSSLNVLSGANISGFSSFNINNKTYYVSTVGNDSNNGLSPTSPVLTLSQALTLAGSSGNQIQIMPGIYSGNYTISNLNVSICGSNDEIGGLCQFTGILTVSNASSSVRIQGLNMATLNHTGAGSLYLENCKITTAFTSSGAGYFESSYCDFQGAGTSTIGITGAGTKNFFSSLLGASTINNASSIVNFSNNINALAITLSAGILGINNTPIYALTSTGNAITSSLGSTCLIANTSILQSTGAIGRVSLAGSYSFRNVSYDLANSSLTGSNSPNLQYFDALVSQGAFTSRSTMNVSGTTRFNSDVLITSLSGSSSLAVDNTGKLVAGSGVGSSTVLSSLLVTGNTTMFSDLRVSGLTILGGAANIGQGQLEVLGTGTNSELSADFRGTGNENIICVGSNGNVAQAIYMGHISSTSQLVIGQRATRQIMYFNTSGNTNIGIYNSNPSATLHISGTSIINNGTTIGSTLNVSGATRIENNLSVGGPITTNSSLYISGATTLLSSLNICNITGQSCIIETFGQGASSFTRFYCDRGLRPHFLSEMQIFSGAIGSEVKRLSLTSGGYVGIGNTTAKDTPQNPIDVRYDGSTNGASTSAIRFGDNNGTGILAAGSNYAGVYNSAFSGFIRVLQGSVNLESSGTITNVCDERIKENIEDITEDPINIINQIRPVEYHHKLNPPNQKTHGLIAQEVEKILPCAVEQRKIRLSEDIEYEDGRTLDYNCVNMFHIKATQQLIKLVNQLKLRIEILENEIKLLKG